MLTPTHNEELRQLKELRKAFFVLKEPKVKISDFIAFPFIFMTDIFLSLLSNNKK